MLFQLWRTESIKQGWGPRSAAILIEAGRVQKRWENEEHFRVPRKHPYRETPLERAKKRATAILAENSENQRTHESPKEKKDSCKKQSTWREGPITVESSSHSSEEDKAHTKKKKVTRGKNSVAESPITKSKKWGKVIWRNDWIVNELRIQERYLFPRLPDWIPLSKLTEPRLRVVTGPPVKKKNTVWEGTFGPVKATISTTQAFKRAPAWSPAKHIRIPRPSVSLPKSSQSQNQSNSKSYGHSH